MVTVRQYINLNGAELDKTQLEESGITGFVRFGV
jgi:hypothetical protein